MGRGERVSLAIRQQAVTDILEAKNSGCRISSACEAIGLNKRTFERWRADASGDKRKGPLTVPGNKLTDEERRKILETVNSKEYRDKAPSQIVPALADKGEYLASESSMYRILKDEKQLAHRRKSKKPSKEKPMELIASQPNQIYSWDITYLPSNIKGMFFFLYLFMDIFSRKIVGYTVENEQSSEHASDTIKKICKTENIKEDQVTLHSDNGSPMKGATMLAALQWLGVAASFSRPSVSNDNPYSESLFKTLKYCPQYPSKPFTSKESAAEWVEEFIKWYNEEHLHSGIGFVTPKSRHDGTDIEILSKRDQVYKEAREKNPSRWSKQTRNWDYIEEVPLNKLNKKVSSCKSKVA